ncbi:hypothetical protein GGD89_000211 [Roseospira visakhapatnamensis]|uniref:Uncharacterized protein n=1 Tax=Roseospira visakhapatnamensis TaxID=390880 RepID=A0A7W6W843_9PROT|nr:hypothetical protein [Roseospira visakhapatnamensis]
MGSKGKEGGNGCARPKDVGCDPAGPAACSGSWGRSVATLISVGYGDTDPVVPSVGRPNDPAGAETLGTTVAGTRTEDP